MKHFDKNNNRKRSFGGGRDGGRPDFNKKPWMKERGGDTPMHKATCSDCGKSCEVPFRPSGIKPVFCKDCFSDKRENDDRGGRDYNDRGSKRDFNNRGGQSFAQQSGMDDMTKRQLDGISMKIDRLIAAIEKMQNVQPQKAALTFTPAPVVEIKKEVVVETKKKAVKPATKVASKKVVTTKKVVKKK